MGRGGKTCLWSKPEDVDKAVELSKAKKPDFVKSDKIPDYKLVAGGRLLYFLEIVVK